MKRTPYEAGGFAFSDEKVMERAVKEVEGIRYVKDGMDMNDPQMVYRMYCQMIRQQIFETPVGYAFMYELQEYLKTNPAFSKEEIPSIPVIMPEKETPKKQEEPVKTKIKVIRKTKVQNVDYKVWFKTTLSACVILLLIVIGMFVITATSGNINIVNYENALIEKYEHWETKLEEREARVREREAALYEVEQTP